MKSCSDRNEKARWLARPGFWEKSCCQGIKCDSDPNSILFGARLESTDLRELRDAVNRGWPYGSERFKDEIESVLACGARPPKRGLPARRPEVDGMEAVNEKLF